MRQWGLLLPAVGSRSEALRRLQASARAAPLDDDGGRLDDESTEVFCNLPEPPPGWDDPKSTLDFKMRAKEQDFLRRKLSLLTRPGDTAPSLLARLVEAANPIPERRPAFRANWTRAPTRPTSERSVSRAMRPISPQLAALFTAPSSSI